METWIDAERGKAVATLLHRSFATTGIFGRTDMPEDVLPDGVMKGSLEHLLFVTLTVAIDYQRDAGALWESSRKTFADPETRYLFGPRALHETMPRQIVHDMQRYRLSKKPKKDAWIWRTVGVTFLKKWGGDPRNFLQDCEWDSPKILDQLSRDTHLYANRQVPDYPYLRGPKIGPLWLRMMRDNIGISELRRLEVVPIPVDVHVARATLSTGVVSGTGNGRLNELFRVVREAWFRSVEGLENGSRFMVALDVDEPLWHLSKYGCSRRHPSTGCCPLLSTCDAKAFCTPGKIHLFGGGIEFDTRSTFIT